MSETLEHCDCEHYRRTGRVCPDCPNRRPEERLTIELPTFLRRQVYPPPGRRPAPPRTCCEDDC